MDGIVDVIECEKDRYLERGDVASSIIKMDRLCTSFWGWNNSLVPTWLDF
jgi:hypothetical protein